MTKFQKLLIDHTYCASAFPSDEEWARHVEDVLNNSGFKVVEVYESPEDGADEYPDEYHQGNLRP